MSFRIKNGSLGNQYVVSTGPHALPKSAESQQGQVSKNGKVKKETSSVIANLAFGACASFREANRAATR
jgi:hypothetical protein